MYLPLRRYFALLTIYLKPQWKRCVVLAFVLFLGVGLQLLNPQILKAFVDTALAQSISLSLLTIALLFIGTSFLKQIVAVADTYLGEYVAWTATNQLRNDLIAHCLSLDLSFHKAHTPGELIERIDGDVGTLSNFFSRLIVQLCSSLLLLLGIIGIFFRIDWRAGLGASLYTIIFFVILMTMRKRLVPLWVAQRRTSADFYSFLGEHLEGTGEIRANGATGIIIDRFFLLVRTLFRVTLNARIAATRMSIVNFALIASGMILTLILGVYLRNLSQTTVTVGTVLAMYTYVFMLIGPIWSIQTHLQDLQQVEACIQRLDELLGTSSALPDGSGTPLAEGPLAIAFEQVTFGYTADEPVLHNVSFSVQEGKVLGVLGRTGSGKTTLVRLLFRFYDIQQGRILLGGIPIQDAYLDTLRQRLGFVTQDVQIFHASVRDNLTFFNREISDERLLRTITDLGLSTWYHSLPDGLETLLGAGGVGLSSGEAQLLACTRVFLQDPGVIILDEASSRLDPATAILLETAMNRLIAGRTTIIIAHRLVTLQRADDIVILEKGALLEYGSRATLEQDPSSHFFHLLQAELKEARV